MNESARSVTSLELILYAAAQVVSVLIQPKSGMSVRTLHLNEPLTTSTPGWSLPTTETPIPGTAQPDPSFFGGVQRTLVRDSASSYEPTCPPIERKS